jgi:hypothetical protein
MTLTGRLDIIREEDERVEVIPNFINYFLVCDKNCHTKETDCTECSDFKCKGLALSFPKPVFS